MTENQDVRTSPTRQHLKELGRGSTKEDKLLREHLKKLRRAWGAQKAKKKEAA